MIGTRVKLVAGVLLASLASLASLATVEAAAPGDPTAPIRQFIDGFNSGDTKSAFATYAPGEISIVDEFAPHRWLGPNAAHRWAAAYDKHAAATGVTDGHVSYSEPTRTDIEGTVAYVVMPTVYTYKEHGKRMVEEGQITVTLRNGAGGWKITGWTWAGVKPHAPA